MLQGTGFVNRPVIHAAIALVVQALLLVFMLFKTDLGLYSLCLANVIYSFLMCIMNGKSLRTQLGYEQEIKKTFVLPFICAFIMGAVIWLTNQLLRQLYIYFTKGAQLSWSANALILVIDLIFALFVYSISLIRSGAVDEEALKTIPKGQMMIKICKKAGLL